MPQQIDIPGVGPVEFPDTMSDAEIEAAAQKLHVESQGSAATRYLKGVASNALVGPARFAIDSANALSEIQRGDVPAMLERGRGAVEESKAEWGKAHEALDEGDYGHAVFHALATPPLSPFRIVTHAADKIREGDVAGGLGEATGAGLVPEVPEMGKAGVRGAGKVVAGTGRFIENHPSLVKEAAAVTGAAAGGAALGIPASLIGESYAGSRFMGHLAGAKLGRELVPNEAVENVGRSLQDSGRNLYGWAGGADADSLLSANRPPVGAKMRGSLGEEIGKQRETMAQDRQLQTGWGERGLAESRAQQESSRLERMVQRESQRADTERLQVETDQLRANPPRLVRPSDQTPTQQMIDMLSQEDVQPPDMVTGAPPQTLTPTGRPSLAPTDYEDLVTAPGNVRGRTVVSEPSEQAIPQAQEPTAPPVQASLGGQSLDSMGAAGAKIRQLVEEQMRQATARPTAETHQAQAAAPVAPMSAHEQWAQRQTEPTMNVSDIRETHTSGRRAPYNSNLSENDVLRMGGKLGVRYVKTFEATAAQTLIDRAAAHGNYQLVAELKARYRHLLDSPNQ